MSSNTLNAGGKIISFDEPKLMGILNLTPDSFYDGNKYSKLSEILAQVEKMQNEGMDILDIGAFSSRPGAEFITEEEELQRILAPLKEITTHFPQLIISVDTFRARVAHRVLDLGVSIINDITAFSQEDTLLDHVKDYNASYVLMHMQGTPDNMQSNPNYRDVGLEIIQFLSNKLFHLQSLGIVDVIIDPGFGFGKRLKDNYKLLKELETFDLLDCPVLAGLSRKSMLTKVLNITSEEALNATTAANTIALMNGANILRVHDIKEANEARDIFLNYENS